jgi:hypothetical protein
LTVEVVKLPTVSGKLLLVEFTRRQGSQPPTGLVVDPSVTFHPRIPRLGNSNIMPKHDPYYADALDAIVETSERSDDDPFPDDEEENSHLPPPFEDGTNIGTSTSPQPLSLKDQKYHEINVEPMVQHGDISFPGSLSFGMLPETIVEALEEEDDSSHDDDDDSIILGNKENANANNSLRKEPSYRISPMAPKSTIGKLTQWASDFETGSVALFNFDADSSSSDDECTTPLRSDHSAISQSRSITIATNVDDEMLSWRLDPSESLSDWTICVKDLRSGTSTKYHVHRNMLAVGQRKSVFFVDLFKQRPTEAITEFFFCSDAVDYVPMVLDWMYIGDRAVQLSTESAPCLRYLAQCLGLRRLFDQSMEFMKADLSTGTLAAYYKKAILLEDQKILNVVARFFARMIEDIEADNELMQEMSPSFFLNILSQPGLDRPESLVHKNLLISSYCNDHRRSITQDEFLLLTDAKYLSRVHFGAAIQLFELELDVAPDHVEKNNRRMEATSLQKRCIEAIAPRWKEVVEIQREAVENILKRLPSFLVSMIMMEALQMAAQDLDQQTKQAESDSIDLRKRVKARVKAAYDKKIKEWHELCKQKDEQIQVRNQELSRFTRLPNAFDGRLGGSRSSTTLSAMPKLGTHLEAGYVLTCRKLGGTSFPLFYYK